MIGSEAPVMDFAEVARALGVSLVLRVSELSADRIEAALRQAMDHDGPAVVICSGPCRLRYPEPAQSLRVIVEDCQDCGRCLEVACPALVLDRSAGKPVIDEALCTGCGVCAEECPFGAIVLAGEARGE